MIGDLRGFLIEAGFLQTVGSVEEPAVLGRSGNQQGFGGVLGSLLVYQGFQQGVVLSLVFAGQDAEAVRVVVEAVRGPVLGDGRLSLGADGPCTMLRVFAIREDLLFC